MVIIVVKNWKEKDIQVWCENLGLAKSLEPALPLVARVFFFSTIFAQE